MYYSVFASVSSQSVDESDDQFRGRIYGGVINCFLGGPMTRSTAGWVLVITVFLASLGLLTSSAGAQAPRASTDAASDVLAFERQIEAAVLQSDVVFLDGACASDFTYTHGDGWTTGGPILGTDTKSEWLTSLSGRYSSRQVDSQQVEIHGDIAITMGRVQARTGGPESTQRSFSFWYVRVYAWRDNRWQYLSHRTVHGPVYEK